MTHHQFLSYNSEMLKMYLRINKYSLQVLKYLLLRIQYCMLKFLTDVYSTVPMYSCKYKPHTDTHRIMGGGPLWPSTSFYWLPRQH